MVALFLIEAMKDEEQRDQPRRLEQLRGIDGLAVAVRFGNPPVHQVVPEGRASVDFSLRVYHFRESRQHAVDLAPAPETTAVQIASEAAEEMPQRDGGCGGVRGARHRDAFHPHERHSRGQGEDEPAIEDVALPREDHPERIAHECIPLDEQVNHPRAHQRGDHQRQGEVENRLFRNSEVLERAAKILECGEKPEGRHQAEGRNGKIADVKEIGMHGRFLGSLSRPVRFRRRLGRRGRGSLAGGLPPSHPEHQHGPDRNAAIRQIESGPLIRSNREKQEVGHMADPKPVDHVPQRPTQDHSQAPDRDRQARVSSALHPEQDGDHYQRGQSQTGENFGMLSKQPEGDAGVGPVDEVEKSRNDFDGQLGVDLPAHPALDELIQQRDCRAFRD